MIKSCCFTGHREIPPEKYNRLYTELKQNICRLCRQGCTEFYTGGAQGFDTMAAFAVLEAKQTYPDINLNLCLPFYSQRDKWPQKRKEAYRYIKENACKITYASDVYTKYCMHRRNRMLVDNADYCIAYCAKTTGGTAYTLTCARRKNIDFINLAMEI